MIKKIFYLRVKKIIFLLTNFRYLLIYLKHNVVPSIEHVDILESLSDFTSVYDVGANKGQFSLLIRALYPKKQIISFEPLPFEFSKCKKIFANDNNYNIFNIALANCNKSLDFYITQNRDSSSLLSPNRYLNIFSGLNTIKKITVKCKNGLNYINKNQYNSFLKIDVQGSELNVLKGFSNRLKFFKYIFIELSHVELYQHQSLYPEVSKFLSNNNFTNIGIYNKIELGSKVVQADYLFIRL